MWAATRVSATQAEVPMTLPWDAQDHAGIRGSTHGTDNMSVPRSRFDILVQELKEAHDQEIAELRNGVATHKLDPSAQGGATSRFSSSGGRSSDNSLNPHMHCTTVGFTWHGKTYGTKDRFVSPRASPRGSLNSTRESGTSANGDEHKLVPALRPPKVRVSLRLPKSGGEEALPNVALPAPQSTGRSRVSFNPEADCEAAFPNVVLPAPASTGRPRVSFNPEADCEAALPNVALPAPKAAGGSRVSFQPGTDINAAFPNSATAWAVEPPDEPIALAVDADDQCQDDDRIMKIISRAIAEQTKSELPCDFEKAGLPPELINLQVKAVLEGDRLCFRSLHKKREVLRYTPVQLWAVSLASGQELVRSPSAGNLELARSKTLENSLNEVDPSQKMFSDSSAVARRLVIPPHSGRRLLWDILTALVLTYDVIALPVILGFRPQESTFQEIMDSGIATVWSLDIVASLLTGYYDKHKDHIVLKLREIALHYLKTWFTLDIILVGYDWVLISMEAGRGSADSGAQLGRSLRTLRFVRTVRLLRLLKLQRIMTEIYDRLPSEAASIIFRILRILICLVIANHMVACMWYFLSSSQEQGSASWVQENGMESHTLAYKYVVSLHWSLSQFTPASMEIFPAEGSLEERCFAVVVILVAMVGFSSFVSILTASMAELRKLASDETHQFWMLRRFLRDWSVSDGLGLRIQHYLEYAYAQNRRRVQFKDVQLLKLVSQPMHHELLDDMLAMHVRAHRLFETCGARSKIFAGAFATMNVARGDSVFTAGQEGEKMYFVCKGKLIYILGEFDTDNPERPRCSDPDRDIVDPLHAKQYASEATLWTHWLHLGDLEAIEESTLVLIKADLFQKYVSHNLPFYNALKKYAVAFVKELNSIGITDCTDLLDQVIDASQIMAEVGFSEEPGLSLDVHKAGVSRASTWSSLMPRVPSSWSLPVVSQWSLRTKRASVAVLNMSAP